MHYELVIPKEHPMREQLEEFITSLLTFIDAGAIYISKFGDGYLPTIITFVLTKNCGQDSNNLHGLSQKIKRTHPDFYVKFFNAVNASHGFDAGEPYLMRHCTLEELVYYEPGNKVFYPFRLKAKKLLKQAHSNFNGGRKTVMASFTTALQHIENMENLEAATYMYIALWEIYSCFGTILTGEFTEVLQYPRFMEEYERVNKFAPHLKDIFNYEVPEDKDMLARLNNAYECTRQKTSMEPINWAIIERAKQKLELLIGELDRLFHDHTKSCKSKIKRLDRHCFAGKIALSEKFQSNYFIDHALAEICDVIVDFLKTRAVYCFGYTATVAEGKTKKPFSRQLPGYHFYLLLLNGEYKENAVPLLQSLIKEQFDGRYTVTILSHRVQNLHKQSQNQKYFFNCVMANGLKIYSDPMHPVYPLKIDMVRDIAFTKNYWENRMLAAESFLTIVHDEYPNDQALILNALLQQAMQHVAIALLDLFLGYHPNIYSIKYMFRLLECIPEVELPFADSEQDRWLVQLLSAHIDMIKHKDLNRESIEDSGILFTKCQDFFNAMSTVGHNELKRLENLNTQDHE